MCYYGNNKFLVFLCHARRRTRSKSKCPAAEVMGFTSQTALLSGYGVALRLPCTALKVAHQVILLDVHPVLA